MCGHCLFFNFLSFKVLIIFKLPCRQAKRKLTISYPCVMLNVDVAQNNTNDQYQVGNWQTRFVKISQITCLFIKFSFLSSNRLLKILLPRHILHIVNAPLNLKWMDHIRWNGELYVSFWFKVNGNASHIEYLFRHNRQWSFQLQRKKVFWSRSVMLFLIMMEPWLSLKVLRSRGEVSWS